MRTELRFAAAVLLAASCQSRVMAADTGQLACRTTEECAEAILWLMSGEAAYMIGAVIPLTVGR